MGQFLYHFMFTYLFLLLSCFHLVIVTNSLSSRQPLCHHDESSALLQFKQSFSLVKSTSHNLSAYSKVVSWKLEGERSDCCSWDGVECDEETGHVIGLDLARSLFFGSINSTSSLFSLVHLQRLNLTDNDFNYSQIPFAIKNLNSLNKLSLNNCYFSGSLPISLSNLTQPTTLELASNNFLGQIPSLASLSQLEHLSLSHNYFNAKNLLWLGKLTKLTFLKLNDIYLYGEIPSSLANLTKLRVIGLAENHLVGKIPSWLTNLTQLTSLNLLHNQLGGSIPSSFAQLANLQHLHLENNNFRGTVKLDTFFKLKKLIHFGLSGIDLLSPTNNSTNGTLPKFQSLGLLACNLREFPEFLRFQDKLAWIHFGGNEIQGQIPEWMWNISKEAMVTLDLSHNFLTGIDHHQVVLPRARLYNLDLTKNMLQGSLPIPPPNTLSYRVARNRLTGEIPPLICSMSSLISLDLSDNDMSGPIPPCLGNFSNSLLVLNLRGNNFHGVIPQTCTKGNVLRMIDLSQNRLEGKLPRSLANCTMLEILDLGDNQIEDSFPFWLGGLSELQVLILRSNNFHGAIHSPKINVGFPKMRIIDLSNNSFTGNLPIEYFENSNMMKTTINVVPLAYMQANFTGRVDGLRWITNYEYSMILTNKGITRAYPKILNILGAVDLSSNKFRGAIPKSVGNLKGLQLLNLSNNDLVDRIPPSLGDLKNLESLDLSQNRLSGEIPQQLAHLTFLAFLNVSYNHLTGTTLGWTI